VQKQQQEPKALSAAAAFSFGERACAMPDLSLFEQWDHRLQDWEAAWDLIDIAAESLLDLAQSGDWEDEF
jgi:hypothetical protein